MEFVSAPEHPQLQPVEAHVWRLELGEPRRPRAARGELRAVLARYLGGKPDQIELVEDERGKPRLAQEPPPLHFNLSHSGALALVAVSQDREVGVDVERIAPDRDFVALAERALTPEDAEAVRSAPEPERAAIFYARWTRHEARLKCLGLSAPSPQDAPAVTVEPLPIDPGYAAAVAAVSSEPLRVLLFAG